MATTTAKDAQTRNRRRPARGGSGAGLTKEENAEHGFTASAKLSENLQKVLVDLIELSIQGKQAHWNVVGRNFRDTHLQLDEVIESAREFSDTVAERMRSLHALPDGRSDTVAETTTLPEFPQGEIDTAEVIDLVTERLDAVTTTCREVHDEVDEEDPTSADILHAVLERLEQLSWMVSAENRTPSKR
jgi:starvation-inducible DNA-binding protein